MSEVNYTFLTLLNPAVGGAAEPHLTGCKKLVSSYSHSLIFANDF